MKRANPRKGQFALARKFDGKLYSVWGGGRFDTKREAQSTVKSLRNQGYSARIVTLNKKYLIYIRKR